MRSLLGWLASACLSSALYMSFVYQGIASERSNSRLQLNCLATAGSSDICYATTGVIDGGRLLKIDLTTGQGALITDIDASFMNSAAIGSNGELFGSRDGVGTDSLCHVDIVSGATCCVQISRTNGLAFDSNDVLFGIIGNQLLTIDPATGTTTPVGPTNIVSPVTGMAFDPITQSLYACTRLELFKLDVLSGQSSSVGIVSDTVAISDIVFNSSGELFAATGGGMTPNNQLLQIDKFTAAPSLIGDIGFTAVSGLTLLDSVVVANNDLVLPATPRLYGNYPNPFNPQTTIAFDLPQPGRVRLEIVDVRGSLLRRLIDAEYPAGNHAVVWDARDASGHGLAAGVYLYRIQTNGFEDTGMMVLVK